MPQARQYKDPLGSATPWTGNAMVNAFGHACGGQRMQLYRTGKVMAIEVKADPVNTFVSARVLSQNHRSNAPAGAYKISTKFEALTLQTHEPCIRLVYEGIVIY